MISPALPPAPDMWAAVVGRDPSYDGLFFTGVRTTGIFCRPTCTARKPLRKNVEFYPSPREALLAGYRPCKRCRPMEPRGAPPPWLRTLLDEMESNLTRRWTDADLEARGLSPSRVRRWFQDQHGMTFHGYHRARRLGLALGRIRHGEPVGRAAVEHGYDSLSGFNDAFRQLLGTSPRRGTASRVVLVNRVLTPLGPMLAGATDEALCLLEFLDRRMLETQLQKVCNRLDCTLVPGSNGVTERVASELGSYFRGELKDFGVPLEDRGTDFQRTVWAALRAIPFGATRSYGALAAEIGRPTAVRAVARANGDNRMAIVIPCHRVVGSDGKLTGYGGGLWRKQWLLDHEQGARQTDALHPGVA